MGPIGFDWPTLMLAAEAWGIDRAVLARFLPEIERGMLAARLAEPNDEG